MSTSHHHSLRIVVGNEKRQKCRWGSCADRLAGWGPHASYCLEFWYLQQGRSRRHQQCVCEAHATSFARRYGIPFEKVKGSVIPIFAEESVRERG
jgi:hypothetical protein